MQIQWPGLAPPRRPGFAPPLTRAVTRLNRQCASRRPATPPWQHVGRWSKRAQAAPPANSASGPGHLDTSQVTPALQRRYFGWVSRRRSVPRQGRPRAADDPRCFVKPHRPSRARWPVQSSGRAPPAREREGDTAWNTARPTAPATRAPVTPSTPPTPPSRGRRPPTSPKVAGLLKRSMCPELRRRLTRWRAVVEAPPLAATGRDNPG